MSTLERIDPLLVRPEAGFDKQALLLHLTWYHHGKGLRGPGALALQAIPTFPADARVRTG